jgi:hypothetical protein
MVQGLKRCYISDEMNGVEDKEEIGNVGSDHENVRQKMCIVKTLKLRQRRGMGNRDCWS